MGSELVTIQSALPLLTAVINASGSVLSEIRVRGTVSAAGRQALKDRIAAVRAHDISQALHRLGMENLELMFELYELADTRLGMSSYSAAMREAENTTRLMRENLNNLARRLS